MTHFEEPDWFICSHDYVGFSLCISAAARVEFPRGPAANEWDSDGDLGEPCSSSRCIWWGHILHRPPSFTLSAATLPHTVTPCL